MHELLDQPSTNGLVASLTTDWSLSWTELVEVSDQCSAVNFNDRLKFDD